MSGTQKCVVCRSEHLGTIDAALVGPRSSRDVSAQYGISYESIKRHRRNHLSPALQVVAEKKRAELSAIGAYDSVESRLETLAARIGKFIDKAEERGAIVGGAAVLREMRSTLELLGKIRGEIDDRPVTQVINVTTSDSWLKMRGILMEIFDAHPEAKRDFLNRMSGVPGALPSGDIIDAEVEDD